MKLTIKGLQFEWISDCGGDQCLSPVAEGFPFPVPHGVAYPDGQWCVTIYDGIKQVKDSGMQQAEDQTHGMMCCKKWIQDNWDNPVKLLRHYQSVFASPEVAQQFARILGWMMVNFRENSINCKTCRTFYGTLHEQVEAWRDEDEPIRIAYPDKGVIS